MHDILYKNFLIRGESFQPTHSSGWIPRYVLKCVNPSTGAEHPRLSHDRLDIAFASASEADDFAVQDAKGWIDSLGLATIEVASTATITGGVYVIDKPIA